MSAPAIVRCTGNATEGEHYQLPAEKRIAGDPRQTVWNHYSDPSGRFSTGIWHSEPGKWHIRYSEHEYCRVLQGVSVIRDAQGQATQVVAGDEFVIPRGFCGTWEVVEATRKVYVIYQPEE